MNEVFESFVFTALRESGRRPQGAWLVVAEQFGRTELQPPMKLLHNLRATVHT